MSKTYNQNDIHIDIDSYKKHITDINLTNKNNQVEIKSSYCLFISCFNLFLMIMIVPFIILDLITGYHNSTCVNLESSISLKKWLIISGFTSLGILIYIFVYVLVLTYILYCKEKEIKHYILTKFLLIINYLISLFETGWIIFGCIIFFRFTERCNSVSYNYVLIRLIISLIYIAIFFVFKCKKN